MTIHFSVQYRTVWGEELVLRVGKRSFGMQYGGGGVWKITLSGREIRSGQCYTYELVRGGVTVRTEWRSHVLRLPEGIREAQLHDRWTPRPANSAFWSSAFRNVIFGREKAGVPVPKGNVILRTVAPEIRPGEALALSGSGPALGEWKKRIVLDDSRFPHWETAVEAHEPFEYKYLVIDRKSGEVLRWEEGENHFSGAIPPKGTALLIEDVVPKLNAVPWRGAGTAIPVFSLRTADSFGIGEFHDIKKMVDWAAATGQNFIQLLPVNDTMMTDSWQDSYPYNAVSSFALHPQFIHLPDTGVRVDKAYREMRDSLNALPQVDYEKVNREKIRLLRKVFAAKGDKLIEDSEYQAFVKANDYWLLPYAVFCCLRDEKGTVDFSQWGKYARFSRKKAEEYAAANAAAVAFWCWIQYGLDVQLKEAVAYAHAHRVAIKGDLPIGVSRTSADAWMSPELFNLDMQAGAPPDAFSTDGQNWGFPTYNWDKMAETGFAWWKARLRKMSDYFDAYRIDHILGFFRIWEIPACYKSGLMGHFSPALPYGADEVRAMGFDPGSELFIEDPRKKGWYHPRIAARDSQAFARLEPWQQERFRSLYEDFFYHRHNDFWRESALRKLPSLLRVTGMLSCGEDLGMIPSCVAPVMDELNILSLEIQRMPKDPAEDFANPASYPYFSVCATGTHDTSTLRGWWEEDRALTQRYYKQELHGEGDAPYFCEPWIAEAIVKDHLHSPSMLCILPLQDYLAMDGEIRYPGDPADERINVPAIARHYWRYRMHISLEELLADEAFCDHIRSLVRDAARGI